MEEETKEYRFFFHFFNCVNTISPTQTYISKKAWRCMD
jgi:hypothetical protein